MSARFFGIRKNFAEVLDGSAKADQNLASLLLTDGLRKRFSGLRQRKQVEEYEEINFEILDGEAKSRLESRFFAADE